MLSLPLFCLLLHALLLLLLNVAFIVVRLPLPLLGVMTLLLVIVLAVRAMHDVHHRDRGVTVVVCAKNAVTMVVVLDE